MFLIGFVYSENESLLHVQSAQTYPIRYFRSKDHCEDGVNLDKFHKTFAFQFLFCGCKGKNKM